MIRDEYLDFSCDVSPIFIIFGGANDGVIY
jgi:hypothetical protein